jgi:hypothetical protein
MPNQDIQDPLMLKHFFKLSYKRKIDFILENDTFHVDIRIKNFPFYLENTILGALKGNNRVEKIIAFVEKSESYMQSENSIPKKMEFYLEDCQFGVASCVINDFFDIIRENYKNILEKNGKYYTTGDEFEQYLKSSRVSEFVEESVYRRFELFQNSEKFRSDKEQFYKKKIIDDFRIIRLLWDGSHKILDFKLDFIHE